MKKKSVVMLRHSKHAGKGLTLILRVPQHDTLLNLPNAYGNNTNKGGMLCGAFTDMFLMLPIEAVLKIIDRVEELQPWGKLLGNEVPVYHMGQVWGKRKTRAHNKVIPLKEALE